MEEPAAEENYICIDIGWGVEEDKSIIFTKWNCSKIPKIFNRRLERCKLLYKDSLWKDLDMALKDALHLWKMCCVFPRLGTLLSKDITSLASLCLWKDAKDAQRQTRRFPDELYYTLWIEVRFGLVHAMQSNGPQAKFLDSQPFLYLI